MKANELLDEIKELSRKNVEAASFERLYPNASNEEKLPHKRIQNETYNLIQAKFDDLMTSLSEMPEAERAPIAREAMRYTDASPVSPFWRKRL